MLAFADLAARLQALHGQPQAQAWALQNWLMAESPGCDTALRLLADQPPARVLMAHALKAPAQALCGVPPATFEACLQANGGDALEAFCLVVPEGAAASLPLADWCDKHLLALAALPTVQRAPALLRALAAAPTAARLLMGELATGRWRSPMPLRAVQQALAQARGITLAQAAWQLQRLDHASPLDLLGVPTTEPQPEPFAPPLDQGLTPPADDPAWQTLPLGDGDWAQCGREDGDAWLWTDQGLLVHPFACALPPHSLLLGRWHNGWFHAVDLWRWAGSDGLKAPLRERWAALQALPALGAKVQAVKGELTDRGTLWCRRWDAPVGPAHAGHLLRRARREMHAQCVYLRTDGDQLWAALALANAPDAKEAWVTVAQVAVPAHVATRKLLEQATQGAGAKRVGPVRHLAQPLQVRFSFEGAVPNPKKKCGWEVQGPRWEGVVEPLFQGTVPGVAELGQA